MNRDGARTSLWQEAMPDFPADQIDIQNRHFDVVVVGGGVTGLTTALELQKAGRLCLVAEAQQLCFGTSGGTTAHLNTFFDTGYDTIRSKFGEEDAHLLAQASVEALELYRQNIEAYSIDCGYEQKDGYLYAQDEKQARRLEEIFDASIQAGVDVAYTDRIPVPVEFTRAIVYHEQAQVHPSRYVYALAKAFQQAGGVLVQQCRVTEVSGEKELKVTTSRGEVRGDHLIWATHIPPGINLLHFRCAPYRSYVLAVSLKNEAYPVGLAYDMYDPYHYYRTQEVDGKKYLIVGGEDHKTAHEENTDSCLRRLEAHVRSYFEVDKICFSWSSQYFEPADGLAYIGHLPGNPENVFVATGFGGNGMTYSHIAARTLTDLITKGESVYADLFSPGRLKPVAGFANFVKENADVVAQFVGRRLSAEKLEELGQLARGQASVVKFEGSMLALYKDEKGELHAVNPTCTHAKCSVGWNMAEKSWDCPCHGARYSIDGEVLTGPASKDLERISLAKLITEEKPLL